MKTVVTGGTGFIGSHVVDRLRAAGHDVDVVDLRAPHRSDVGHWPVDICDLDGLVEATKGADAVFHLAAYADVNDVAADPVGATETNVTATAKVWEACRRNDVKRVVLASTVWVYGAAAGEGEVDEAASFKVDGVGHLYTASKLAAEMVAESYKSLYGVDYTILRYGIPYGPRMRDALVIPKFVKMALNDDPITVHGDGSQYRNYVYVEDLAEAHVLALRPEAANQIINLEGRESVSIRQLVEAVGEVLDRPVNATFTEARAGDYAGRDISAAKAENILGWVPEVPFKEGLRRYVAWHLEKAAAPAAAVSTSTEGPDLAGASPWWRRVAAARMAPGVAAAAVLLPTLAATSTAPALARAGALAGSVAAGGLALALRNRERPRSLPVAAAAAAVAVWLIAQAAPGVISVPLGVLLGMAVGDSLAGTDVRSGDFAVGASAGGALLMGSALFERHALFWLGALLACVVPVTVFAARGLWALRRAVPSWRYAAATVAVATVATTWVGASSARAAWFGNVVYHGPRATKQVAITFDETTDAPVPNRVFDILDSRGLHATFFVPASHLGAHPDLVEAVVAHGDLLANEGVAAGSSAWLTSGSRNLSRDQAAFARQLQVCPTYFRPAHGRHNPLLAREVGRRHMRMVTWEARAPEGAELDPARLAERLLSTVHPGSIVAFPLGDPQRDAAAMAALPLVLDGLRARGLEPVRLDTLLDDPGYAGRC
jgi:UDP-glucose 4-epimerase